MTDEISNAVDNRINRLIIAVVGAVGSLLVVGAVSLMGWLIAETLENQRFRQACQQNEKYILTRIGDLESGRTIRMAETTRAELDAVWRALGKANPMDPK